MEPPSSRSSERAHTCHLDLFTRTFYLAAVFGDDRPWVRLRIVARWLGSLVGSPSDHGVGFTGQTDRRLARLAGGGDVGSQRTIALRSPYTSLQI